MCVSARVRVCMCACMCVLVCVCLSMLHCMFVCVHLTFVCALMFVCVCVWVGVRVYMRVCVHACTSGFSDCVARLGGKINMHVFVCLFV